MQYQERWKTLCEQASTEQDGQRLLEIVQELNRVLDHRLSRMTSEGNETVMQVP